jgi:hypothetical protein
MPLVIVFVEVDRDHAIGRLGVGQPVRMVVDHEYLLGAEHPGDRRAHQANRACAIDRNA